MTKRTFTVAALGAAAGAVLGILTLAAMAGLVMTGTATAVLVVPSRSIARPEFVAEAGAMYLLVLLAGAVAGVLISTVTVALMSFLHPEEPRFRPAVLVATGAVGGAVLAYVALRAGLGWGGSIVLDEITGQTIVTLSVFRATLVAAGAGAFTGLVTATTVEYLSRPAVVGLEGEAWPQSRFAFLKETTPAMAIPILALVIGAVVVFAFSRVLLAGHGTAVVVTVFSAVAALILGGAAFIAAHPPSRSEPPEQQT